MNITQAMVSDVLRKMRAGPKPAALNAIGAKVEDKT